MVSGGVVRVCCALLTTYTLQGLKLFGYYQWLVVAAALRLLAGRFVGGGLWRHMHRLARQCVKTGCALLSV